MGITWPPHDYTLVSYIDSVKVFLPVIVFYCHLCLYGCPVSFTWSSHFISHGYHTIITWSSYGYLGIILWFMIQCSLTCPSDCFLLITSLSLRLFLAASIFAAVSLAACCNKYITKLRYLRLCKVIISHGYHMGITWLSHGYPMVITWVSHWCYRVSHGYNMNDYHAISQTLFLLCLWLCGM